MKKYVLLWSGACLWINLSSGDTEVLGKIQDTEDVVDYHFRIVTGLCIVEEEIKSLLG
ncbi:hypothetical protein KAR91_17045 [Candidatus Pacearchaeota archaeon]|nr:hypothetical protein [Candidatus Pacearchaeota archaeon]